MEIKLTLNGKPLCAEIEPDLMLIDFLRSHGCYSVKRGCETSACGLCTVLMDGKPILSCSMLAARADGRCIDTLEGLQEEAAEFVGFIADEGAEQCGFCSPGFIMTAWEILETGKEYTDAELRKLLSGHLCRCTGYENIFRAVKKTMYKRLGKPMPEA